MPMHINQLRNDEMIVFFEIKQGLLLCVQFVASGSLYYKIVFVSPYPHARWTKIYEYWRKLFTADLKFIF